MQTTHETSQIFPFAFDQVFEAMSAVLPTAGYPIESSDKVLGRIAAAAPASGFSWGEKVVVRLERTADDKTNVIVQSSLKVGSNWAAANKNAQNAERIISAASRYLQSDTKDAVASVAQAPSATAGNGAMAGIVVGVVVLMILGALLSAM